MAAKDDTGSMVASIAQIDREVMSFFMDGVLLFVYERVIRFYYFY